LNRQQRKSPAPRQTQAAVWHSRVITKGLFLACSEGHIIIRSRGGVPALKIATVGAVTNAALADPSARFPLYRLPPLHIMSLVAHVPEIELVSPSASTVVVARESWCEILSQDLPLWNDVLLRTNAWLYQYPLWNEPQRTFGLTPRYLAWGPADDRDAFACVLSVGFRGAKIGLVFRGPTSLKPGRAIPPAALAGLLNWARAEGYMFMRFTHSDPEILSHIACNGRVHDRDVFPYLLDYPILSPDYVVQQCDSEEETLAHFDREVKRKLRRAAETGYEFCVLESPESLAKLWPLYEECSHRKGFRLERPLSVYMDILRWAHPHHCGRVYSVRLNGETVGSTLVVRDGVSAHCILAAFVQEHRSSAVFLHWKSMRDLYRTGIRYYNLGPGPGSLARFKEQFSGRQVAYPPPVTIVLNKWKFQVWKTALFPIAKLVRPALVQFFSRARK
jgi:hypothetical protein